MARTVAEKERQFCFRMNNFLRALLNNRLLKTIVGTEAPKEVLDKFTIEDFELFFIEMSAVMYSIKNDDKIRLIVLLIGGF